MFMKPGRAEIPELGLQKEFQSAAPETTRPENLKQAVGSFENFALSFKPNINPSDFKKDIDYRIRAAELFANKSKEEVEKLVIHQHTDMPDIRLLYGIHELITRDLIEENVVEGRSYLTHEKNLAQLQRTIEFQQNFTRFIIQNRTMSGLDTVMQKYWSIYENISYRITKNPEAARKNENGIEHAVTASQILEERGWRTLKPRIKDDMKNGIDGSATGPTLSGKEIILATQFKTNYSEQPIVSVEVLYPFPLATDIDEDAWDLVANIKELRLKNLQLPLFPVLMRVPSSYQTAHILKGTGLLDSPQSMNALLDEKAKKALEYAEILADAKIEKPKPNKKKVIYVPQAK